MVATTTSSRALDGGAALVLVADSVRAQVFEAPSPAAPLAESLTLLNPDGRLHERDLVDDATGRRNHRPTQAKFSMFGGGSAKAHRAESFAALVCERVRRMMQQRSARRLYVVAEPQFLGLLRQRMNGALQRQVAAEVPKALAGRPLDEIRSALPAQL
jgi:protein required for attachment to host cells